MFVFCRLAVIAGRNLTSMDVGGKSDPYCILSVGEEEAKTVVQYNTVNPQWNASFSFSMHNGPHFQSNGKYARSRYNSFICILKGRITISVLISWFWVLIIHMKYRLVKN